MGSRSTPLVDQEAKELAQTSQAPCCVRLRFTVLISNQMPRVFHGAGIVVQFNVAGKLSAVDEKGYADLGNAIIPPRSEQQGENHRV